MNTPVSQPAALERKMDQWMNLFGEKKLTACSVLEAAGWRVNSVDTLLGTARRVASICHRGRYPDTVLEYVSPARDVRVLVPIKGAMHMIDKGSWMAGDNVEGGLHNHCRRRCNDIMFACAVVLGEVTPLEDDA